MLLTAEGHDVRIPSAARISGAEDARHFMYAIRTGRGLLTRNHEDFDLLHHLVLLSGGHHPGILVVRRDNDSTRDMSAGAIVRSIRNLTAADVPIPDSLHILNHWR